MEGPSPRPRSKYTPEEWRALTIPDRIVAERKEALEKEIKRRKKQIKARNKIMEQDRIRTRRRRKIQRERKIITMILRISF